MANEIIHINNKEFLNENALHSTSALHSKLYKTSVHDRPKAQMRITDCNGAIRWWNYVDTDEDRSEFIEKIDNALNFLQKFRNELGQKFEEEFNDSRFKS